MIPSDKTIADRFDAWATNLAQEIVASHEENGYTDPTPDEAEYIANCFAVAAVFRARQGGKKDG